MPAAWAASSASAIWPQQPDRALRRQRPLAGDQPAQVAALDQAHRDDQLAVLLAGVVDGDDAGVVEAGGEPRLAQEALAEALLVDQLAGDHLQRHGTVERQLRRPVDDAHAAAGDQRVDAVAGEHGADCGVCHAAVIQPRCDEGAPSGRGGPYRWSRGES